jgi:hypothetical protein
MATRRLKRATPSLHRLSLCRRLTAVSASRDEPDMSIWSEFFDSDDLGLPEYMLSPIVEKAEHSWQCYGCGVAVQTDTPARLGYVDHDYFEQKARHKQASHILCSR